MIEGGGELNKFEDGEVRTVYYIEWQTASHFEHPRGSLSDSRMNISFNGNNKNAYLSVFTYVSLFG